MGENYIILTKQNSSEELIKKLPAFFTNVISIFKNKDNTDNTDFEVIIYKEDPTDDSVFNVYIKYINKTTNPITIDGTSTLMNNTNIREKGIFKEEGVNSDNIKNLTDVTINFNSEGKTLNTIGNLTFTTTAVGEKNFDDSISFKPRINTGGKKSVKKQPIYVKINISHKCKDGIERVLYQKGENFYVKVKSKVTGKFVFKKTKV
jgi:hypothetical protein